MIRFNSDYTEGAHPLILQKLEESNFEQTPGYGEDDYCKSAAALIRRKCQRDDVDVHFMVGGTQTNFTVISSALRPYQSVLSASTGHIFVHETGAVEATGHKVEAIQTSNGKITAEEIEDRALRQKNDESFEHITQPKMVYISNSTEIGTIYSKKELEEISQTCHRHGLYLYMDGARLGYALTSGENDLDLPTITELCDVFYIGGTKQGALFGEAVVITRDELKKDFRYMIKQKGGMLAKGRLLGIQFLTLFQDDLYFDIAREANEKAEYLRKEIEAAGYSFLISSPTNQQFPIFPDSMLSELQKNYSYAYIQRVNESSSAVRFCTSWATRWEAVNQLGKDIRNWRT